MATPEEKAVKVKPATVKVKVTCPALYEAGQHYTNGDTFETTAERAACLRKLVKVEN